MSPRSGAIPLHFIIVWHAVSDAYWCGEGESVISAAVRLCQLLVPAVVAFWAVGDAQAVVASGGSFAKRVAVARVTTE